MDLTELDAFVSSLEGVRRRSSGGLLQWRRRGRLVARQLDEQHVVIRSPFDTRDVLVHQFPDTFSVPTRFSKHMMVVADLAVGSADAIEEAVVVAWRFQAHHDG
ncbi:MAG: hypothetical protein ACRDOM_03410 [Nocardioides sp.]